MTWSSPASINSTGSTLELVERIEPVLNVGVNGLPAVHRAAIIDRAFDSAVIDVVGVQVQGGT